VQDGRIYIEKINGLFLHEHKGTPDECRAGRDLAIERGWLKMHESGTYVKLTQPVQTCSQQKLLTPLALVMLPPERQAPFASTAVSKKKPQARSKLGVWGLSQGRMPRKTKCATCDGVRWVCETCPGGAAGAPCPTCNPCDELTPPALPSGLRRRCRRDVALAARL
jgi:hypothetical protein